MDRSNNAPRASRSTAAPVAFPVPLAGVVAALWAGAVSLLALLLCFSLAWIVTADPSSSYNSAVRVAIATWLLSNGSTLYVGNLAFGLVPLLPALFMMWIVAVGMRWAIRSTVLVNLAGLLGLIASVAVTYTFFGLALATFIAGQVSTTTSRSLIGAFSVATIGCVWAVSRAPGERALTADPEYRAPASRTSRGLKIQPPHDLLVSLWTDVPRLVRQGILTGVRAVTLHLIASAVVALALVIVRFDEVLNINDFLSNNQTASLSIGIIDIVFAPTVVVWTASTLLGPGISVGLGSTLSLFSQSLGPLPTVPFLAVLPPTVPRGFIALLAVPLISAIVAARRWIAGMNRNPAYARAGAVAVVVLSAAVTAGGLCALLAMVSAGGLGGGRFGFIGPNGLLVGLAAAGWTAAGLLIAVAVWRLRTHESAPLGAD